jgi:hypothetical protein
VRSEKDNCTLRKLWVSSFDHELPHHHSHPPHYHLSFAVVCDDCSCACSVGAAGAVGDFHYALQTHHHHQWNCHFADLMMTLDCPCPE